MFAYYLGCLVVSLQVFFDFKDVLTQSVNQVLERADIFLEDLCLKIYTQKWFRTTVTHKIGEI